MVEARLGGEADPDLREGLVLDPDFEHESWQRLISFCEARNLAVPEEAYEVVGGRPTTRVGHPSGYVVDGMLGGDATPRVPAGLKDPTRRVQVASDLLLGHDEGEFSPLLEHLNEFSDDELIRLLPPMVVATSAHRVSLMRGLSAENPSVRQCVALAFGEAGSPGAATAICEMLVDDPSESWRDAATALGQIGEIAMAEVAKTVTAKGDARAGERAVVAFREAGERHGVELIADLCAHEHALVRASASRALATLGGASDPPDPSNQV
ncbi:MAG: HEAT repeat domain-containing protein, partial [Nannocystaceae bacterium]